MSRRPGFVLEVDKSAPPTLFWNGEGFTLETLPEGSRVIYAPEPLEPAGFAQPGKIGAGNVVQRQITRANNPCLLGETQNLSDFQGFHV